MYLGHGDVEADQVDRLFKATSEFFLHQWSLMEPWIWLEVEGLHPSPVFVSMLGEQDTGGILLCWDLETAEQISRGEQEPVFDCLSLNLSPPERLGEEMIAEIEANDWPVTTLGVPLLARPNRLERMSPLAGEIGLMLDLFEVLPSYFRAQGTEVTAATSHGQTATVRLAVGDFGPAGDPTPEELLAELQELEGKQQWSMACALALAFQEQHDMYDELLMMKATSYMARMGSAGTLDEFVQALGKHATSVWEYVKAWAALARGHKPTFRKRLKKAVKGRPDIAHALLHQTESGSEPFLVCWSEIWREHPEALDELRALQKA